MLVYALPALGGCERLLEASRAWYASVLMWADAQQLVACVDPHLSAACLSIGKDAAVESSQAVFNHWHTHSWKKARE